MIYIVDLDLGDDNDGINGDDDDDYREHNTSR